MIRRALPGMSPTTKLSWARQILRVIQVQENESKDYVTRVFTSPMELPAAEWNALLARQSRPTPFMRHEYLCALHESGSAVPDTGWTPRFVTLWRGDALVAACPLYLKDHSYGEYVFDWAWADAYQRHGLAYFPKAVIAVPFTPVPGTRLLASDAGARAALVQALLTWCRDHRLSSLHLLFGAPEDIAACTGAGLMPRHTVQFHWSAGACRNFDGFLGGHRTSGLTLKTPTPVKHAHQRYGHDQNHPPGWYAVGIRQGIASHHLCCTHQALDHGAIHSGKCECSEQQAQQENTRIQSA